MKVPDGGVLACAITCDGPNVGFFAGRGTDAHGFPHDITATGTVTVFRGDMSLKATDQPTLFLGAHCDGVPCDALAVGTFEAAWQIYWEVHALSSGGGTIIVDEVSPCVAGRFDLSETRPSTDGHLGGWFRLPSS